MYYFNNNLYVCRCVQRTAEPMNRGRLRRTGFDNKNNNNNIYLHRRGVRAFGVQSGPPVGRGRAPSVKYVIIVVRRATHAHGRNTRRRPTD